MSQIKNKRLTMTYQEILALLTVKFQGVRKDGLEQMARMIALQCSNEEEAKTLVEKITDAQVNDFVKEYRKVVDKEVSDSNKTFETNLKKKYDLVEKKPDSDPNAGGDPKPAPKPTDDIATIVANAVASAVKPLQERLDKYEKGDVEKSRLQTLTEKLNACKDETFKEQTLKDFKRMQFDSDDAFTEYLTEKETDIATANQNVANSNLRGNGKPLAPSGGGNKEASKEELDAVIGRMPI